MRSLYTLLLIAAVLATACESTGGGSAPAGGGAPSVSPARATAAPSAMPSGNPDVDNYGY